MPGHRPEDRRRSPSPRGAGGAALLVLLALLPWGTTLAQAPRSVRFSHLGLDQGLSQGFVNCILQDRRGFIWLGTQDGLNRYDGYSVTVFKSDPDDARSLRSSAVWALAETRDGALWVGTDGGGLNRFDPATETFTAFGHDPRAPTSLSSDRLRTLLEDADGMLWVGTDGGGLNRFDPRTRVATRFRHDPRVPTSLSSDRVRSVVRDRTGRIWVGTDGGGLSRLDPARGEFTVFRHDPADARSLGDDRVRSVYEDREGRIWVATYDHGLNRLDPAGSSFARYEADPRDPRSISNDRVRAVLQDRSGAIWVGTDGGLNEWNPATGAFARYRHVATDPFSLSVDRVLSLFEDRGGVLWVGTQGGGASRWNLATSAFGVVRAEAEALSSLSNNDVWAVATDTAGAVWIGTYAGLNRYDRAAGTFTVFRHDPARPASLSDDRVMSLAVDGEGTVWAGTLEGGLNRLERGRSAFVRYRHMGAARPGLSGDRITAVLPWPSGEVFVGVYRGGLNRLDPRTGRVEVYRADPAVPRSLSSDDVIALAPESSGKLWVGTDGGGLNLFDPRTGTATAYRRDPTVPASLSQDVVFAVHEDANRDVWVGTQGAGLNRWAFSDRQAGRVAFQHYTQRQGLANDTVYGILEGGPAELWMSTNRGLSRLDRRTGAFRNFDTTHGLQGNEFNAGAHHRGRDGELFFGGTSGLSLFHPSRVRSNEHRPPLAITSFQRLGERVRLDPAAQEVVISHRDYVVSFEFAALDFTAPERNRYAYRLEGLDRDWIDLGAGRRATYTNLAPGRYVLRARGSNNDGLWNDEGVALRVAVRPPPWRTTWAYLLYGLAVAGSLRAYVRAQRRRLEREAEYSRRLEREVAERTRELAERNEELQTLNRRLEDASLTDSLTGLANRRFLNTHILKDVALVERFCAQVARQERPAAPAGASPAFALVMVDLDRLKWVNDSFGHDAGDRALLQMRDLLLRACRRTDTVLRWGGDEFLVVGRYADLLSAESLAERIRAAVERHPFDIGAGSPVRLTSSIGFALYPFAPGRPDLVSWEQVLSIADRGLYAAKNSGRNAWVGIQSTSATPMEDVVALVNARAEELAREGLLRVSTSLPPERLAWGREGSRAETPARVGPQA